MTIEEALRDRFVVRAIALTTGMDEHAARDEIRDLTTNACIGELVIGVVEDKRPDTTAELFEEVERRYEASRPMSAPPHLRLVR